MARLRYAALPITVLTLSIRRWQPAAGGRARVRARVRVEPLAAPVEPLAHLERPVGAAAYWTPVVGYLHRELAPSYRVEVVGTADHWEAVYLPQAGIPIVRGWFRQDDFPQNEVLYDKLTRADLSRLAPRLSVRYVVLTDCGPDYSARTEAALLLERPVGLRVVFRLAARRRVRGAVTEAARHGPRAIRKWSR